MSQNLAGPSKLGRSCKVKDSETAQISDLASILWSGEGYVFRGILKVCGRLVMMESKFLNSLFELVLKF